jgi:hypothetical protein
MSNEHNGGVAEDDSFLNDFSDRLILSGGWTWAYGAGAPGNPP